MSEFEALDFYGMDDLLSDEQRLVRPWLYRKSVKHKHPGNAPKENLNCL